MSSVYNSSNTPLVGNAAFTGSNYDHVQQYHAVNVMVFSDQDGSLALNWSNDATNVDFIDTIAHTGGTVGTHKQLPIRARFVKAVYTNGTVDQNDFRLYVNYLKAPPSNLEVQLSSAEDSVAAVQSGSWTVTANAGTDLNTSALALESGGNLATIAGAVSGSEMQVDIVSAPTLTVDGSGVTQPVSAVSLPLPTGAASEATLSSAAGDISLMQTDLGAVKTAVEGTLAVSATALPLPTGAASEATLSSAAGDISLMQTDISSIDTKLPSGLTVSSSRLLVDAGSGTVSSNKYQSLGSAGWNVTGSACSLKSVDVTNRSGFERFVRVYNKSTTPTSGDTPNIVYCLQANSTHHFDYSSGVTMSNGLGLRATAGIGDSDTTDCSTDDILVSVTWA